MKVKKTTNLKSKQDNKGYEFIFLAFVLAAIITLITFIVVQYFPFGPNIILRVDLYHQYAPFHEELRSKILNGQSLFYSWEGGLGKEMISQIAYYTSSPISFLILFFSSNSLPEAMAVFVLLKIAFSAGFFAYYLRETFNKNDLSIVAFSLFYAFMAFITSYYWNVMWLDAIALFPLVALGIDRLIKENKHKTYGIALAIVIIVNFYIAFIVCVFAVLYYLVALFSEYSWKKERGIIIQRSVKFAVMSLIGGGISMFLTLPTAIALSRTAASDSSFPKMKVYENVYQLITNHFLGTRPVVLARNEDLPNVYSGVLTMLLLPFYFINSRIKTKEKVLYGLFILFMLVCSCINTFDYLIHGMHFPSNLPHRYTFIYSFILLKLAYTAFLRIREVKFRYIFIIFAAYVAIILFTEFVVVPNNKEVERVLTDVNIIINISVMICYIIYLAFYKDIRQQQMGTALLILTVMVFSESTYSSIHGLKYVGTTNREKYVQYIDNTEDMLNYIEEQDNDENKFYRQEFRRFTTINDSALYHYKGFSQFSSLAYGDTSAAIGNLGIAATGNSYRYYDPTPLIDAMFNIKYVMNKDGDIKNPAYTFMRKFDNVSVYKNNQYLPLGFMTKPSLLDWTLEDSMPFEAQNDFVYKTTDVSDEMMNSIDVLDFKYENIKITKNDEPNVYKYELTNPENLSYVPKVTARIHNDKEQKIYIYVDAGNAKRFKYTINGSTEDRELSTGKSLIDCGIVPSNTDISIEFTLDRKGEYEKTYRKSGTVRLFAANFNFDVFDKVYEQLNDEQYVVSEYSDTKVKGVVTAKEDGIMFTSIPFDSGWSVTIDGARQELVPVADGGFIGINVPAGEHEVIFKYKPKGFFAGVLLSIISIAAFVFYNKRERRRALESD